MVLYEFFNTTNQSTPHFERHENFVSDIHPETCAFVQTLPYEMRCEYVQQTDQCRSNQFFFDYTDLIYCQLNPRDTYAMTWGAVMLILICAYMFLMLAVTADCFFCPCLKVLSRLLGFSENLAGITLLAFGNGAPDLFTSIAGVSGDSRRLYSDILGSAIFVVFIVGGLIVLYSPFRVKGETFIRDVLFLLSGILLLDYVIKSDQIVTLVESICLISLYICYIIIILIDQVLLIRHTKISPTAMFTAQDLPVLDILPRNASMTGSRRSSIATITQFNANLERGANYDLFRQFLKSLLIEFSSWSTIEWSERCVIILRAPIFLILTLLVPVVDYEVIYNNWSKLLNSMHIIVLPTVLSLDFFYNYNFVGIPLCIWVAVATIPIAIYVFQSSRTDKPPVYHRYFSFIGVVGSVFVVYTIARETISVLEVLGIISSRSNSYLGCTVLSWGNSMGDLTANIVLAKHGYQIMGFSACLGGPMFSSLVIVSIIFLYKTSTSPTYTYQIAPGTMGDNCFIFIAMGLTVFLVGVTTTNYMIRRSIGLFMLCVYGIYFVFTSLGEFELVHTFGTDHRMDYKPDVLDFHDLHS